MSPRRRGSGSAAVVVLLLAFVVVGWLIQLLATPWPYIALGAVIAFYVLRAVYREMRRRAAQQRLSAEMTRTEGVGLLPAPVSVGLAVGEVGYLEVPARLARMKSERSYVGGSRGFSVPIGAGIRYRFGNYAGHSVSRQVLSTIDAGSLILTNRRLVFLGSGATIEVPLARLMTFDVFTDAIRIHQVGKERVDTFFVGSAGRVAGTLDLIVAQSRETPPQPAPPAYPTPPTYPTPPN